MSRAIAKTMSVGMSPHGASRQARRRRVAREPGDFVGAISVTSHPNTRAANRAPRCNRHTTRNGAQGEYGERNGQARGTHAPNRCVPRGRAFAMRKTAIAATGPAATRAPERARAARRTLREPSKSAADAAKNTTSAAMRACRRDEALDLLPAGAEPPQHAPAEHDGHQRALVTGRSRARDSTRGADEAADAHEQRAETIAVQDGHRPPTSRCVHSEKPSANAMPAATCSSRPKARGPRCAVPHADPDERSTFERPRGRRQPRIERERHGERREHDAERQKSLDEQAQIVAMARVEQTREQRDRGRRGRSRSTPSRTRSGGRARLQSGGDERRAEHERRVDVAPDLERAAQRVQRRDADVEQEEQDQERLGRREILGPDTR